MKLAMQSLATFAAVALISILPATARAALLVRYVFDESASGTTNALNTGGNLLGAADGVFSGNATRTTNTPGGKTVAALNLNPNGGNNDFVGPSSDLNGLDGLSTLTMSTWLNVQSDLALNYYVLANDQNWSTSNGWTFYFTGNGNVVKPAFQVQTGATNATATVDAANKWVFLAATWDQSTGNLKFYSGTTSSAVTQLGATVSLAGSMVDNADALRVGANPTGGVDRTPNALMDDFRIYDTVLDSTSLDAIRLENLPEPTGLSLLALTACATTSRRRRLR